MVAGGRAQRAGAQPQVLGYLVERGHRGHRHDRGHADQDQDLLGHLADAEPDDEQRDERQRGQRPEHLDDRVDRVPYDPAGGHARAQDHPDRGAGCEADQDPAQADQRVVPQGLALGWVRVGEVVREAGRRLGHRGQEDWGAPG
jgi:hypothetical protein